MRGKAPSELCFRTPTTPPAPRPATEWDYIANSYLADRLPAPQLISQSLSTGPNLKELSGGSIRTFLIQSAQLDLNPN